MGNVLIIPMCFLNVWFYIKIKYFLDTNVSEALLFDILSRIRTNILGSKLIQRRLERKMNFKAKMNLTFSVKIFPAPRLNLSFKSALSWGEWIISQQTHTSQQRLWCSPQKLAKRESQHICLIRGTHTHTYTHTTAWLLPMVTCRTPGCELRAAGKGRDYPV